MTTKRLRFPAGASEAELTAAILEAGGLEPGAVVQLDVLHDDDCPKLVGGACRCEPEHQVTISPPVDP